MTSVDIVIVNWNSGDQLRECLQSIRQAHRDRFRLGSITVVDNASADDSAVPADDIRTIRNEENRGFAAAANQGARVGEGQWILFLNPDARLFHDTLDKAMAFVADPSRADLGICGVQLLDETQAVTRTSVRFPQPRHFFYRMLGLERLFPSYFPDYFMSEWEHDENREVDHVIGAFYLVRRELFRQNDGFDERFFVYLEDLDFSLRAAQAGWRCYFLAEAQAFHRGGGTSEKILAVRLFYSLRSRLRYAEKHFDPISASALFFGMFFVEPFTRIVWALVRGSLANAVATIGAYALLLTHLPETQRVQ